MLTNFLIFSFKKIFSFWYLHIFRQKILTTNLVLLRFRSNSDLLTVQKIQKKKMRKKNSWTFFWQNLLEIFFLGNLYFLRIFWKTFWSSHRQNPSEQLVIGYHWFAFLNQVPKNLKFKFCTKKFKKIGKLFLHTFQNIVHLFGPKTEFFHFWREGLISEKSAQLSWNMGNT